MYPKKLQQTCPNCPEISLEYEKGSDLQKCPKCGYMTDCFEEDGLVFLFNFDGTNWQKQKVFAWDDGETVLCAWKTLALPKAIVSWDLGRGCRIQKLYLSKSIKFKREVSFEVLEALYEEHTNQAFQIRNQISIFVKEWAAGISHLDELDEETK